MASRGINKVILVGNLGNDPDVRYTPQGSAITSISIATSESWKDKNTGQVQEKTEWHRVSFFGKLAEIAGEYLRKGSQVYVEGKLETRKWQNKHDHDQYTTTVIVDSFNGVLQMLGARDSGGQNQQRNNSQNNGQYHSSGNRAQQNPTYSQNQQQQPAPANNGFDDSFDDDIPF